MDCHRELLAAICKKFDEDQDPASVKALLGHDPYSSDESKQRIGLSMSDACSDGKQAFMAVSVPISRPMSEFPTAVYRGVMLFKVCCCGDEGQSRTISIVDRLNSVFYGAPSCDVTNRWYCDFSTCKVRVRQAVPLSRSSVTYDKERGRYCQEYRVSITWSCDPGCGCDD